MANKKLTDISALSPMTSGTVFLVDDSGTTQTVTGSVIKSYITNSDMVVSGNITSAGSLVPSTSNTYTLGTPTFKWADMYIGPNSIHIQDTANSANTGILTVTNGILQVNGLAGLQANLIAGNTTLTLAPNGNINMSVTSVANVLQVTSNATKVNGNLVVTSNTGGTATSGAISISADGTSITPQNPGVMLSITGQGSNPARVYVDGVGTNNYAAVIGRHYNGTSASPSQLLNNDIISRYGATPYSTGGWPAISTTRMDMIADENQTATNQGSRIEFWLTPTGSNTIQKQVTFNTSGATINGDLSVTGNVNITGNVNAISYGLFGNTANITASANTATPVLFDTTIANLGITKGTGTSNSRIIVNKAGTYAVKAQLGVYQNGPGTVVMSTWFRKNGSDIAYSQDSVTLNNNPTNIWFTNDTIVPSMAANDYIEVYWALVGSNPDIGHIKLVAQAAQTSPFAMPASPSVIVTVTPVA
jgi:hypothetical protein